MIDIGTVYLLCGIYLAYVAWQSFHDKNHSKRLGTTAFWALLAIAFLAGGRLPPMLMGILALVIAGLAGSGAIGLGQYHAPTPETRAIKAQRLGNRLFIPALLIPAVTLLGVFGLKHVHWGSWTLLSTEQTTIICLAISCAAGFTAALRMTGERLPDAIHASRGILDSIGWAVLLPLLLAMLGGLFNKAGIGDLVATMLTTALPLQEAWVAVLAYGLGMVLFTMVMGNAFAAFPVMMAAIGLPLLIQHYHGDPAVIAAVGMLAGFCGTLMTPMAANFNIVPAALLELKDQNGVIRQQIGTAVPLWVCNVAIIYVGAFLLWN